MTYTTQPGPGPGTGPGPGPGTDTGPGTGPGPGTDTGRLKFLALNGSERPDGNIAHALRRVEEILTGQQADLEVVRLWDLRLTPCGPCGDCNFRTRPCDIDDGLRPLIDRMAAADALIYATSVHGFGSAPTMPTFLERSGTGHLRFHRVLTNKVGGVLVTGRRYSHVETHNQLLNNVLLNRMIVPGHGFPCVLFGNQKGEVLGDEEGMEMLRRMVVRMVRLARVLREHRELTGTDLLADEYAGERDRCPIRVPARQPA
ncbi:flavodoxin family protein [Streptomyces sp. NPDC019990]|uniref:flavodoxin family protein n=1 Tax=Streptomyces sp. NPDC019990 TaxID=3154693 RepID=UPI0033EE7767